MNLEIKSELRPCKVKFGLGRNRVEKEGLFYGIYQRAHTTIGMVVGTVSGQYAEHVAVVEINGQLLWVPVKEVQFTDVVTEVD